MKTKQQLIEDVCILICKHNDLVREIDPIAKKVFEAGDERFAELAEFSLSRYLSIFTTSKKAYIGGCGNMILNKINKLKQIKEELNNGSNYCKTTKRSFM